MVYDEDRIGQLNLVFNDEDKVGNYWTWAWYRNWWLLILALVHIGSDLQSFMLVWYFIGPKGMVWSCVDTIRL